MIHIPDPTNLAAADPVTSIGLKVLVPAAKLAFGALRLEWLRREPAGGYGHDLARLEPLLDEALRVLAGQGDGLVGAAAVAVKGMIARPKLFSDGAPRAWVESDGAQVHLKAAVFGLIRQGSDSPSAAAAIAHYHLFDEYGPDRPEAELVYGQALGFLLLSLERAMTVGERVLFEAINSLPERIADLVSDDAVEIIDAEAIREIERIRKRRFFVSSGTTEATIALAAMLQDGRLKGTSPTIKARGLACCARWICFTHGEVSATLLARAIAFGGSDLPEIVIANAFLRSLDEGAAAANGLAIGELPAHGTAWLQILQKHAGREAMLERARIAEIGAGALDADGHYVLIASLLQADRWDDALQAIGSLGKADYAEAPALLWIAATALVAGTMPEDLRPAVLQDVPIHPGEIHLAEDGTALEQRRTARRLMLECADQCEAIGLAREAAAAHRYALWLDLRDPIERSAALDRLADRVRDPATQVEHISLALGFALPHLEPDRAEQAIARAIARNPKGDIAVAAAALALIFDAAARNPKKALELIETYRELIKLRSDPDGLIAFELRLLVDDGRIEEARARFAEIDPDRLPAGQRALVAQSLETAEDGPSIEVLEQLYADSKGTPILSQLVETYRRQGFSARYLELARTLVITTRAASDALSAIRFLVASGHEAEADALLSEIEGLVPISPDLRAEAAWLHFNAGRLDRAEADLASLEAERDHHNDRALRFHILVAAGRWPALAEMVESEWRKRDQRSARELIQLASLAAHTKAPRLREIILLAVNKAPDDPHVLIGAYNAAVAAGLEEQLPDTGQWLNRGAEFSDEDGPIKVQSLDELIARQPEWNQRVEDCYRDLAASDIPFPVAALMLRRAWLELQLVPLVANRQMADGRRRALVPLFSGKRAQPSDEALPQRIALDRTAIVTLAYLGRLDHVLSRFEKVVITHGALCELFEESQRIAFHQPSKIAFARELVRLLGRDRVRPFRPTTTPEAGLVADIGQAHAAFLIEAAAQTDGQHIVIHPNPITRVGSLLREPVDLERFADQLGSCSAVVDALAQAGVLTVPQQTRARLYLQRTDARWPGEQAIRPGATLYLSDLSVDYFRYAGILDKIERAGFTVILSPSEIEEAHSLLDYAELADEVGSVIEAIRLSLAAAIADGRVVLNPIRGLEQDGDGDGQEEDDLPDSADPMIATGTLATATPLLVSDDRFINRYSQFDHPAGPSRILTSLELLGLLAARDGDDPDLPEIRTTLRQAGALMVPLSANEVRTHLVGSALDVADLRETAELRAIRENMRLIQLRGWFDVETELGWLIGVHNALIAGLSAQWSDDIPDPLARARSRWILDLLDMRDWADSLPSSSPDHLALHGIIPIQTKLALAASDIEGEASERYAAWLEEEGFGDHWSAEPRLRPIALSHLRHIVTELAKGDDGEAEPLDDRVRRRLALNMLPPFLRLAAVADREFRNWVGVSVEGKITLGQGLAEFRSSSFFDAVRATYAADGAVQPLTDTAGGLWTIAATAGDGSWPLTVEQGPNIYHLRGQFDLHPDAAVRLAALDTVALELRLSAQSMKSWHAILEQRPLANDEVDQLADLLARSPIAVEQAIAASVEANEATYSALVPTDRAYYEQLTGTGSATNLRTYIADAGSPVLACWLDRGVEGAQLALLLGAHPDILHAGPFDKLSPEEWHALGDWATQEGDLLAKVGFIEQALRHAGADAILEAILIGLIEEIDALDPEDEDGRFAYASALFILVDGELSRNQALVDWPPFRRRIAAIAQAAIIERATWQRIDRKAFAERAIARAGWRFATQSFVDLRAEPRWHPDHIDAKQMRFDYMGRILNAANAVGSDGLTERLSSHLLDSDTGLLARLGNGRLFWPGPIEGQVREPADGTPPHIAEFLDKIFDEQAATLVGTRGLIQANNLFRLADNQIDPVVDRLRTSGPHLLDGVDADELQAYLLGLAFVAASHRHDALADQVEILARHRRQVGMPVTIAEEMHLALAAAAARPEPADWRVALGRMVGPIAFQLQDKERAEQLVIWIDTLAIIDPLLRTTLGRTRAGLALMLGR